jgi:hypothetical protein
MFDSITPRPRGFNKRVGLGTGVALTLSIVVVVAWHSFRPKPWNEDAIHATFDGFYYDMSSSPANMAPTPEHIGLRYVVVNSTDSDYVLSPEKTLFVLRKGMLDGHPNFQMGGRFVIPAGQRKSVEVLAPPAYNTTWDVDGFVVFDSVARYKIVLRLPEVPLKVSDSRFS